MIYSSPWKRLLAYVIDMILVSLLAIAFWGFGTAVILLAFAVFITLYNAIMMGTGWHATLGQRILGMKVVNERGKGISFSKALLRSLCFWVSSVLLCLGHLVGIFTKTHQALHDRIVDTYVVKRDSELKSASPRGSPNNSGRKGVAMISGEKAGTTFYIRENGLIIGCDPNACQIILENSKGVSHTHCYVTYSPSSGMYVLTDKNSTYGTFNQSGRRVHHTGSIALQSGDCFYLGSPQNMFQLL